MNSGVLTFVTKGRAFNSVGTHQKFDREAYRLIRPFVKSGSFPHRQAILRFEGIGGPDGLKVKGNYSTDHLWDPINEIGKLPIWIESHFKSMVVDLEKKDMVEASFHAGWMAHYLTDSLTPAHHVSHKLLAAEHEDSSKIRRNWLYWGRKGIMSSHVAFEAGISSSIVFSPIKSNFDAALYERALKHGIAKVMQEESYKIAQLDLYDTFLKKGWSSKLARQIKISVVPRIPQLIAVAWLVAYRQAGYEVSENLISPRRSRKSIG